MQGLAADLETTILSTEQQRVVLHRFTEARAAGLTRLEARLYAESEIDCGLLRRLVARGCRGRLLARIVL